MPAREAGDLLKGTSSTIMREAMMIERRWMRRCVMEAYGQLVKAARRRRFERWVIERKRESVEVHK